MAYQEALEAAGAKIVAFEQFGSYQGDWWALVNTPDGRWGWINGSYGSCSGCDAFEAEFGWGGQQYCTRHEYGRNILLGEECEDCTKAALDHTEKLAAFGMEYLDGVMTQEEAEIQAGRNLEWDSDAQEMLAFVKANGCLLHSKES